jgi:hypothetical protein
VAGWYFGPRAQRACGGRRGHDQVRGPGTERAGRRQLPVRGMREVAGVVRVARARSTAGSDEPSSGAGDWLVLKYFLGTVWHSDTSDVLDAVQALIDQGNVDPVVIRQVSWTLWDITPFYCPECRLNYCSLDWDVRFVVSEGSHDCILGSCPNGHRHLLG